MAITSDTNPSSEALVFADSTGTAVGSIQGIVDWDDDLFNAGIAGIKEGIDRHPSRLDMRFGLVAAYMMRGMADSACTELLSMVKYGHTIDNRWLTEGGKAINDGTGEMLSGVVDYCSDFFNGNYDSQCRLLSEEVLKLYPDDLRFINFLGALCFVGRNYDEAKAYFNKAYELDPCDPIVMSNIAQLALTTGKTAEAIEMCDKILALQDVSDHFIRFARDVKSQAIAAEND